jgi:hypothetical protein
MAVDGRAAAHLDGCLDVDLESSALTNTLPVHRLGWPRGSRRGAGRVRPRARPARRADWKQSYARLPDEAGSSATATPLPPSASPAR